MAHFEDLSPCTYFRLPGVSMNPFVAIGWLERDHPFSTGEVPKEFFEKLVSLCVDPFQPMVFRGWHTSSLRQFPQGIERFRFGKTEVKDLYWLNLFVPNGECIFVAPVAILDYIDRNWYRPPDAFISAVNACPPSESIEYKKLFIASGGREIIQSRQRHQDCPENPPS